MDDEPDPLYTYADLRTQVEDYVYNRMVTKPDWDEEFVRETAEMVLEEYDTHQTDRILSHLLERAPTLIRPDEFSSSREALIEIVMRDMPKRMPEIRLARDNFVMSGECIMRIVIGDHDASIQDILPVDSRLSYQQLISNTFEDLFQ